MSKLHIKKGDLVEVISGSRGKVMEASPADQQVIIEGVHLVSKHVKPRNAQQAGGIVKAPGPVRACKVMLVCPKCGKPTRIAHKILNDGTKQRLCKNTGCGETF